MKNKNVKNGSGEGGWFGKFRQTGIRGGSGLKTRDFSGRPSASCMTSDLGKLAVCVSEF